MAELKAKIGLETNAFETGLARLQNKVGSFAKGISGMFVGFFAIDKLVSSLSNAISKGDQLQDLANKFGISASQLQQLGNAAELSGASLETVASAMNKAAINASKAGTDNKLAESFSRIGLSVQDLRKASPQDIMMAFADAAQKGALGADEFRLAQELMGRSATDLLPTLRMGSSEIDRIGKAMGVFTDEQIAALSAAKDAITVIGNAITLVFGRIAAAIVPAAAAMARFVGATNLADVLSAQPSVKAAAVNTEPDGNKSAEDQKLKVRQQIFDIEEKIRQGRLREPALAEELIGKYKSLTDLATRLQLIGEMTGDDEKTAEALNLRLEATKIRERLAGMGQGNSSQMQILADSLQQVGGGGRFAQIGGGETQVDYLRKLTDIGNRQLRATIDVANNTASNQSSLQAQ